MIVRTTPDLPAQPDAIRAMERLEAQLRRAADDLAAVLPALRQQEAATAAAAARAAEGPPMHGPDRCNALMWRAHERCARYRDHRDSCRTQTALDARAARRKAERRGAA